MQTDTFLFDNTGYAYDVSNPTKQTEELAYILKGALLGASPLLCYSMGSSEMSDYISKLLAFFDDSFSAQLTSIHDAVDALNSEVEAIKGSMLKLENLGQTPEVPGVWFATLLSSINDYISLIYERLDQISWSFDPEEESNMLAAIEAIAATSGFFMESPGKVVIEKVVPV